MKKLDFLKKTIILIFLMLTITFIIYSNTDPLPSVTVDKIPENLDDFIALRDKISSTPEGGATMMILALIIYTNDTTLGLQCLTISAAKERLTTGDSYKGFTLMNSDINLIDSQIGKSSGKSYVPRSYVKGTKTENLYEIPPGKLTFDYFFNSYSGDKNGDRFKVFVKCTGADSPRPITMTKNDKGIWKAAEYSTLVVGVKKPKEKDDL